MTQAQYIKYLKQQHKRIMTTSAVSHARDAFTKECQEHVHRTKLSKGMLQGLVERQLTHKLTSQVHHCWPG